MFITMIMRSKDMTRISIYVKQIIMLNSLKYTFLISSIVNYYIRLEYY